jgi:hypothetical protein
MEDTTCCISKLVNYIFLHWFKTKTVKIGNQRVINVVMESDVLGLEEVVVIGMDR